MFVMGGFMEKFDSKLRVCDNVLVLVGTINIQIQKLYLIVQDTSPVVTIDIRHLYDSDITPLM